MSGPGLFSLLSFSFLGLVFVLFSFPRLEGSPQQVRGLKLAPTGQGGSSKVVEQDPCPVDDDKLLTTNQPTAFIMLVPELNTTHTNSSTCFFSSPPLPSPRLLHMSAPGRASRTISGRSGVSGIRDRWIALSTPHNRRSVCPFPGTALRGPVCACASYPRCPPSPRGEASSLANAGAKNR